MSHAQFQSRTGGRVFTPLASGPGLQGSHWNDSRRQAGQALGVPGGRSCGLRPIDLLSAGASAAKWL